MPPPPTVTPALYAHAAFVRRLAVALVGDGPSADDVVQETWLAALGRRPGRLRAPRAWLATVARNAARKIRRGEARRARREQACARPEATASTVRQVERQEVVRRVGAALFRLPPPQRAVVLMRFYEEKPLREIAHALDVSVNTVKSRLRLALDRLRRDLDADGPGAWRPALVATFGLPEALGQAGSLAAGAATTPAALTGGLLMGTKTKGVAAAALALLLAGGGLYLVGLRDEPLGASEAAAPAAGAGTVPGDPGGLAGPTLRGSSGGGQTEGRPPPQAGVPTQVPSEEGTLPTEKPLAERWRELGYEATTPPTVLEGMLLEGTEPLTKGEGLLWRGGQFTTAGQIPVGEEPVRRVPLSSEGVFRFEDLEDGPWCLGVELEDGVRRLHYGDQPRTGVRENARRLLEVGTAAVRGSVLDAQGRPATEAVVRVGVASATAHGFIAQVGVGPDGRYAVDRLAAGGAWVTFALAGDFDDAKTTYTRQVVLEAGRWTHVDHGAPHGDTLLRGVLRCRDGTPVAGPGRVILSREGGFLIVVYDAEGRYEQQVPEGTYKVTIWPPDGGPFHEHRTEQPLLVRGASLDVDLVLPGTRVVGRVLVREERTPGGVVSIREVAGGVPPASGGTSSFSQRAVGIREDGTYAVYALGAGSYTLRAHLSNKAPTEPVTVAVRDGVAEVRQDLEVP